MNCADMPPSKLYGLEQRRPTFLGAGASGAGSNKHGHQESMTNDDKQAAALYLGITLDQFERLASGHIVPLEYEGVRRDEREACAKIADQFAADAFNMSREIRARK